MEVLEETLLIFAFFSPLYQVEKCMCTLASLILGQCVNSRLILLKNLRNFYYVNHLFQESNPQINQNLKEGLF